MKIHKSKNMDLTFLQRIERKESKGWGERLASFSLSLLPRWVQLYQSDILTARH